MRRPPSSAPRSQGKNGQTPVYIAADNGHAAALRVLLEHGVDADKKNSTGWSPLDCAKEGKHAGCVALLERHGAK